MYAITGITGQVGGSVARALRASGEKVRAVVRNKDKAQVFIADGMAAAIADFNNLDALTAAFTGVEGVFVMIPADFAPAPGFPEARAIIATLKAALEIAHPPKLVVLSSVGAQHDQGLGLITQLHLLEAAMNELSLPVTFVRPAWFMENAQWDINPAQESGEIQSFLVPLDRPIPMVATEDIGRVCAQSLLSSWQGKRVIQLEGPQRYSPQDLAHSLSVILGRSVHAVEVERARWTEIFEAGGMPHGRTDMRVEMLDGFNSGWIAFEQNIGDIVLGTLTLDKVIQQMVGNRELSHSPA